MKKIKLIAIILFIALGACFVSSPSEAKINKTVTIFYSPTCPHCHHLLKFVDSTLKKIYPTVKFDLKNTQESKNMHTWNKFKQGAGLDLQNYGVPQTYVGDDLILGFGTAETTGKKITTAIENKFFK